MSFPASVESKLKFKKNLMEISDSAIELKWLWLLKEKQRENSIIQKPKPDKIDKLSTLGFLQTETSPSDFLLLPPQNWIKKDYGGTSQTLHIHPRFHEVKQQKPFWGNFCCSQKWELIPWFLLRSTRGREKRSDFYKLLIANVESKNTKLLTCSH